MVGAFRKVGFAEGISFLALLSIAMPLKYLYGQPIAVKIVGWVHGMLFVAYVILANRAAEELRWPTKRLIVAYVAAILPFGTFVFDRKYLRHVPPL
jgi:integral membrane protein